MQYSSPAPFEKYHRRVAAGLFIAAPIFYTYASRIQPSLQYSSLIDLANTIANNTLYTTITISSLAFLIYTIGYIFEILIFGVLIPATATSYLEFHKIDQFLESKIKTNTLYIFAFILLCSLFIIIFPIYTFIIMIASQINTSYAKEYNPDENTDAIKDTTQKANLGHINEIEKLTHLLELDKDQKTYVFKKIEDMKTNLVYLLSTYSVLFSFLLYLYGGRDVAHFDQISLYIDRAYLLLAPIFFFSSLGIVTFTIGKPQYDWIVSCIYNFPRNTHAS